MRHLLTAVTKVPCGDKTKVRVPVPHSATVFELTKPRPYEMAFITETGHEEGAGPIARPALIKKFRTFFGKYSTPSTLRKIPFQEHPPQPDLYILTAQGLVKSVNSRVSFFLPVDFLLTDRHA
jgi:hypothetical protein